MDHWQYLTVLGACMAITLPLEIFRPGVYRQAWRTARAVLPVAAVFILWDELAIAVHIWHYNPAYVTGVRIPFHMPIEEVVFFLVIPLCALLTYNAVSAILRMVNRR